MRWLHCSDFHIGKDRTAQERLTTKIVEHVAQQISNGFIPDLVFITGDIANSGSKTEYNSFREVFLNPLREALGGKQWSGRIMSVPGNHDVDRLKNNNFDRHAPLNATSQFFDPDNIGKVNRDILSPRFKAYRQGAVADIAGDWINNSEGAFSERLIVRGIKIGVVGVNTAWLSKDEKDRHFLTPGIQLVEAALAKLEDCQVRFVLGHHPLNWFYENNIARLRALFGKNGVIYLHGHMHQADGSNEDGAGNDFLVIQAGAAFQARDGEPWENGLLWGEINLSNNTVLLSPRFWNPNNLDWPVKTGRFPEVRRVHNSDWWAYPLPRHKDDEFTKPSEKWQVPTGWEILTRESLLSLQRDISRDEAELFFDGAEANWALAQSPKVAQRVKVGELANLFINHSSKELPLVVHLTGPGGEGKSMILRQTLVEVLQKMNDVNLLWHLDETSPLPLDSILTITDKPWIIATDAADMAARSIYRLLTELNRTRRVNIQFLLCSRDTDWRVSGADRLEWKKYSDFRTETMSGLSEEDAKLIAFSWNEFEHQQASSVSERAQALLQATRQEAAISEGALLGGILTIRHGTGLRAHIEKLMERLKSCSLENGESLYEAFAYIAVMHAEKLEFLSRPVLAKVMNLPLKTLGSRVIVPLAKEAAANGGTVLQTRHRKIAEVTVRIIREDYGEDLTDRYVALAKAAKNAKNEGFVPELHSWDFLLPEHFAETNPEASVRIASALLEQAPENAKLAVSLARFYREAGNPELGAQLLKSFTGTIQRGFWYEWATCAGNTGDSGLNAVLAAWELTDQNLGIQPDIKTARLVLSGLGVAFGNLYENFLDSRFSMGRAAAAWLGLQLPFDAKAHLYIQHMNDIKSQGITAPIDLQDALSKLTIGVEAAWDTLSLSEDIINRISKSKLCSFDGLGKLFSQIKYVETKD